MSGVPVGRVLSRALSAAGVHAVYGRPLAGLPVTAEVSPEVAGLLAAAHRTVLGVAAAAHLGEGRLLVPAGAADGPPGSPGDGPARPGPGDGPSRPGPGRVDADDVLGLAPGLAAAMADPGTPVELRVDPEAVVADGVVARPVPAEVWSEPDPDLRRALAGARAVVVLAGPGVVRRGAVGGLRALAAAGRLGVLNTWGAKGVFHWRSRHHWATVGLQELDFELGGLPGADLVLAVGVDDHEAPPGLWGRFPHRHVPPEALGPLAEEWPGAVGALPGLPPLRQQLAAVTQAGWTADATPVMPTRVTRHYAEVLGDGGLVAADAGTAGYWVARTFATTRLGAAAVPPTTVPGWAAACALVARLAAPLRPVLAAVDGPVDGPTTAVLAEADRLGVAIGVEVWQPDGEPLAPDAHLARLGRLAAPGAGGVATLVTDDAQLAAMVAVAGPVRAWAAGG